MNLLQLGQVLIINPKINEKLHGLKNLAMALRKPNLLNMIIINIDIAGMFGYQVLFVMDGMAWK